MVQVGVEREVQLMQDCRGNSQRIIIVALPLLIVLVGGCQGRQGTHCSQHRPAVVLSD